MSTSDRNAARPSSLWAEWSSRPVRSAGAISPRTWTAPSRFRAPRLLPPRPAPLECRPRQKLLVSTRAFQKKARGSGSSLDTRPLILRNTAFQNIIIFLKLTNSAYHSKTPRKHTKSIENNRETPWRKVHNTEVSVDENLKNQVKRAFNEIGMPMSQADELFPEQGKKNLPKS